MIAVTVTHVYTAPNAAEWAVLSAQATLTKNTPLTEMPGWTRTVTLNTSQRKVTIVYTGSQPATAP